MPTKTTTKDTTTPDTPEVKLPTVKQRTAIRKAAGLSQTALAALVGVSPMQMNKVERGVVTPKPEVLAKYAQVLTELPEATAALKANGNGKVDA